MDRSNKQVLGSVTVVVIMVMVAALVVLRAQAVEQQNRISQPSEPNTMSMEMSAIQDKTLAFGSVILSED